jgi:hypothetical protein
MPSSWEFWEFWMCPVQMIGVQMIGHPVRISRRQRPAQHHADGLAQQVGRTPVECERRFRGEPPLQCKRTMTSERYSGSVLSAQSLYPANAVSLCVVPILRTID